MIQGELDLALAAYGASRSKAATAAELAKAATSNQFTRLLD